VRWKAQDALDRRFNWLWLWTARKPQGVPRAFWMRLRALRIIVALLFGVMWAEGALCLLVALGWSRRFGWREPVLLVGASVAIGATLVSLEALHWIIKRRFVRWLREQDYRMCLHCGYVLTGLPDEHQCPECGAAYKLEETVGEWRAWVPRVHV
jgi:hypothetical protein